MNENDHIIEISMVSVSFNQLAEERKAKAWDSWRDGKPAGYFDKMTPQAVEFFHENGFLVFENGFSDDELLALQKETAAICRGDFGLLSGMKELPKGLSDDEILREYLCIHFPHKVSKLIYKALSQQSYIDVLTAVIGPNVKCMQSMLFIKSAGKPGQAWHQDEIYIPTRDRSLTGGWLALDDATLDNGCLWVIPGSHKRGILYEQEWHGDPRFDCAHEARNFPWTNDDAVPVEVKAGSVVFFNGYLLHRSLPNYSAGYRRALVNHYMSAESFLPWGHMPSGVHTAVFDNRDIVMIAGEDPYAHKGVSQSHGGHVRPDGKGGCGNFEYNSSKVKILDTDAEDDH